MIERGSGRRPRALALAAGGMEAAHTAWGYGQKWAVLGQVLLCWAWYGVILTIFSRVWAGQHIPWEPLLVSA